jgi:hypothetical protein
MKKENLNQCMLFKMKNGNLCVLLQRNFNNQLYEVFYNSEYLTKKGQKSGLSKLESYDEKLNSIYTHCSEFDLTAIKQLSSTNEVLYHVLNDIEPDTWDWVRKEENSIDVVIKAAINQESIEDIKKSIDELQNKLDNLKINLSLSKST